MGTTLTGTFISQTYDSLIKVTDNDNLTSTAKRLTDGLGNDSPLFLSTTKLGVGVTPTTTFQVAGNSQLGGNLTVTGNLIVQGTTTTVDTDTLSVKDPLIIVGSDNTSSDAVDLGFYGVYDTSGSLDLYAGLFRDASDAKFHLFKDLQVEPTTTVNKSATGYTKAGLVLGALEATTGSFTGNIELEAASGFAQVELGGPSGAIIDLKKPFSDDYDLRLTTATDSEITASGTLKLNAGNTLTLTLDGSNQSATFTGNINATRANGDHKIVPSSGQARFTIESPSANGNNVYLALKGPDTEWRFITNRGDLNSGNQGDLFLREETQGVNVLTFVTNTGDANFVGDITVSGGDITLGGTGRIQGVDTVSASTDAANKAYVDAQITAQDLDIAGDSGTGTVDLDSQTFTIAGGTNVTTSVSNQTVTINATGSVDGSGTANDVVMWQDSDTLTDAPIAISGNNATFAGSVSTSSSNGFIITDIGRMKMSSNNLFIETETNGTGIVLNSRTGFVTFQNNGAQSFQMNSSNNATFAGRVIIGDDAITTDKPGLVVGDTSNGGQITIRGLSPTLAFDKTGSNNPKILTDGGLLEIKSGTLDSEGSVLMSLTGSAGNATFAGTVTGGNGTFTNLTINATEKLRFDGAGGHTFIEEDSNDTLIFATGGTTRLTLDANATFSGVALFSDGNGINFGNSDAKIYGSTANGIQFNGGGSEKMRLNQGGDLLVGTTDNNVTNNSGTGEGINIGVAGIKGAIATARIDQPSIFPNRLNSDGDVIRILKDGTTVSVIGTQKTGLGTSSPDTELHIAHNSDDSASGWLTIEDTDTTAGSQRPHIVFQGNGTEIGRIRVLDTTGMQFATGSSTSLAMTIDQSQNVGIGTTSPSHKLHVVSAGNGEIKAERTSGAAILTQAQSALGRFGTTTNHNLQLMTNSNTGITIDTAGKVGIGTTSPSVELHVKGGAEVFRIEETSSTGSPFMTFFQNGTRRSLIQHLDSGDLLSLVSEFGGIRFMTASDGTEVERMRIDSSGQVGIGTTSPARLLHLDGSVEEVLRIGNTGNTGAIHFFEGSTRRGILGYSNGSSIATAADAGDMVLRVEGGNKLHLGVGGQVALSVDDSDNVGIGTTSPFSKLSINSNGAPTTSGNVATTGLTIHNGSGGTAIQIGTNDSAYSYIQSTYVNAANNLRELRFILGNTTALKLDTSTNATFAGGVTIGQTGTNPLLFSKTAVGDFDTENFYRIKFNDQGGIHNDVGIGQMDANSMGFNITPSSGASFKFNAGTSGNILELNQDKTATFAGNINLGDGKKARFGAGEYLQIQHNGTDSQITSIAGHLQFTNTANDKDITFATDDGSGGDTEYFRIDGGAEKNIFSKPVEVGDLTITGTLSGAGSFVPVGGGTFTGDVTISKAATPLFKLIDTTNNVNLLLGADDTNTFLRGSSGSLIFQTNGANAALTLDDSQGAVFAANVFLGDGKKLNFGAAPDFEIFHNDTANVNVISSLLSRQMNIQSDTLNITNQAASTTYLSFASGGAATFVGNVTASSGTGHFSVVNASAYQLNGTTVMDSSRNLVNIGNIRLDGDSKNIKFNTTSFDDWQLTVDSNGFVIYNETDARYDLKISGTGVATFGDDATFSGDVTATGGTIKIDASGSGEFIVDRGNDTSGAVVEYHTNGTIKWFHGLRGNSSEDFFLFNYGTGANALHIETSNSKANFSGVVQATDSIVSQADDAGFIARNAAGTVIGTMGAESSSTPNIGMVTVKNNGNNRIVLNSNGSSYITGGSLGIGTTAPTQKLDVRGGTGAGTLTHAIFTGTTSRGLELRTRSDLSGGQNSGCAEINSADSEGTGGDLALSSNGNVRMFIDGSGKVGIGETSPDNILHVKGSSPTRVKIESSGTNAGILLNEQGTDRYSIASTSNGTFQIFSEVSNATRLSISSAGDVQIGSSGTSNLYFGNTISASSADRGMRIHTNNANVFFDFQGEANDELFFRDYDGSGGIHTRHEFGISNGAIIIAGGLTQNGSPSDIKYKENIKTISNGIDKIQKLNPVEFDWNDKSDAHKIGKKEDAGFIAQEVQKVLPNLVNENVDGDLALNYEGIIPYLVQSIQELKKEIEILKNK